MDSAFTALRQKLLELMILLKSLSNNQFLTLTRFEQCDINILSPSMDLARIIESVGDADFERLVASATKSIEELRNSPHSHGSLSKEQLLSFRCLLHLVLLQEMITMQFTIPHLMKLTEIIPQIPPDHQLKLLQQLQQWLFSIDSRKLEETWRDFHDPSRSSGESLLFQELVDHQDRFAIEQPLQGMISFEDWDEVRSMCEGLTQLHPPQLVQLVRILQFDPIQILEIRQFLSQDGWKGLQSLLDSPDQHSTEQMCDQENSSNSLSQQRTFSEALSMTILEQPPEQTVYRRNLRPYPAILVHGDERAVLQAGESLVVEPMLYRYDNLNPVPEKLTGIQPLPVTTGATVVFKKLKILVTSNQLNNTLFFLQFELRKVSHNKPPETLAIMQSNPIFVVSHTTLLKKPTATDIEVATIGEVIPPKGTSEGGTKVAILGNHFVDTPNTRVWFDSIEVKPEFHGPKTLTCFTPRHDPGQAIVCVSNVPQIPPKIHLEIRKDLYSIFTFEPSPSDNYFQQPGGSFVQIPDWTSPELPADFDALMAMDPGITSPSSGTGDGSTSGHFNFSNLQQALSQVENGEVNCLDHRGYAPLHYSVAAGDLELTRKLLENGANPDLLDKHGNSPMYWAVFYSHESLVALLGAYSRCLNGQNRDGDSLLHLASGIHGGARTVLSLIQLGAWLDLVSSLQGQTALHNAAAIGDVQIAYCLLRFGAFLNAEDEDGETALHWAIREGHLDSVRLLLQAGIDVNHQNECGETALHLAVELEFLEAVRLILDNSRAHARMDILDETGASPLRTAVLGGNREIQQVFVDHGANLSSVVIKLENGLEKRSSHGDSSPVQCGGLDSFKYDAVSLLSGYSLLSV